MHGCATFNMIVSGPKICCRYEMWTARPYNEHSQWKLCSRDIGEKTKQNSASVFNTSHGTWRVLMHEKPCLIPILQQRNLEQPRKYTSLYCKTGVYRGMHYFVSRQGSSNEYPQSVLSRNMKNSRIFYLKTCSFWWWNITGEVCHERPLVCVEVLRPSQSSGVMSSAVSLPNHTFTGQA